MSESFNGHKSPKLNNQIIINKKPESRLASSIAPILLSLAASGHPTISSQTEKDISPKDFQIIGVETSIKEALPGSIQYLDAIKELPTNIQDSVYNNQLLCSVLGSMNGDVDFTNHLIDYSSTTKSLRKVEIKIPVPDKSYSGINGYGYFIVCGFKLENKADDQINNQTKQTESNTVKQAKKGNQIKVSFVKRVVYKLKEMPFKYDDKNVFGIYTGGVKKD